NDLGVIIDSDLSFTAHITDVISKQRIYLLFEAFQSQNIALMVFSYKTYVLPILEYCCTIWSPSKLGDIDRPEDVQRYFTKSLDGLCDLGYENRLIVCSRRNLELRRLLNDLIMCFKIVHKLISLYFLDYLSSILIK